MICPFVTDSSCRIICHVRLSYRALTFVLLLEQLHVDVALMLMLALHDRHHFQQIIVY